MRARLERLLRRLGAAGVLGMGVLLGCGGFYLNAVAPMEARADAERLALQSVQHDASPHRPVSANGAEEEMRPFYELFPSPGELADEVQHLHRLARGAGLDLAQGEYRLERRPAGLSAYRVTLPVRGSYAQLRRFLSAVLSEMPTVSIDGLRFERRKSTDTQLDAQLRVTLHARPSGDPP
jgi:Tfp pilus assembly protein PilO